MTWVEIYYQMAEGEKAIWVNRAHVIWVERHDQYGWSVKLTDGSVLRSCSHKSIGKLLEDDS